MNQLWEKCVEFHGHECPGLAIGYKAAEGAMKELGITSCKDEEILCITENDACGVDAVQFLTGCTLGKGNLIYKGTGKMAFTFYDRSRRKSIRFMLNRFGDSMDQKERQQFLLDSDYKDIFKVTYPEIIVPEDARIFQTIICDECGEGAPEHKMRLDKGKKLCLDCYETYTRGWN
ncbi:MAG: FmdE family protein [Eubacteriales bacterium]